VDRPSADDFDQWLVQYDDQLRVGLPSVAVAIDGLPEEVRERYRETCKILDLLEAAWPRAGTRSYTPPATSAPADDLPLPYRMGNYELLRRRGGGGMGNVYEALHLRLKRIVAVKLMKPAVHAASAARFAKEIEACGRVVHPNVVHSTDAGEQNGQLYLAMEYVDGYNLDEILSQVGRFSVADACAIACQACAGLDAIRVKALVHRDIKPSNLMLNSAGQLKILDLGLARLRDPESADQEATPSGYILGTLDYQAPEQGDSAKEADIRSDLYSLGCTLFKLLTGKAPYASATQPAAKLYAHRFKPFPRLPAPYPPGLQEVLDRMIAKNPGDRFAGPCEAGTELQFFASEANLVRLFENMRLKEIGGRKEGDIPSDESYANSASTVLVENSRTPGKRIVLIGVALSIVMAAIGGLFLIGGEPIEETPESPEGKSDPKQVVAPVKPGIAPVPKPLEFEPGKWATLLEQEPKKLCWPRFSRDSHLFHNANAKEIVVNSDGTCMLELGVAKTDSYILQISICQASWAGGLGIFFGYRTESDNQKLSHVQIIDMAPTGRLDSKAFCISRKKAIVQQGPKGADVSRASEVGTALLPFPGDSEAQLEIKIQSGNLHWIKWGGQTLNELSNPKVNKLFSSQDYIGAFGTYSYIGAGIFRNARFITFGKE
jgi:hypothetical protein